MGLYNNGEWLYIEEHLNDLMYKQCRDQGDLEGALQHSIHLVKNCAHRSGHIQQQYLQHFTDAVRKVEARKVDISTYSLNMIQQILSSFYGLDCHFEGHESLQQL